MHGGQAIPAFDFYLAPFVRKSYIEEVKVLEAYEERVEDWLEALEESGEVPPIFGRARNRARSTTE
jgi:anaerobic ribonucleoside-triphosphate reductase